MNPLKQICDDMAADPNILKFSDITKYASNGALTWNHNEYGPWLGAVLGVSIEASKRAVKMTEELIDKLKNEPSSAPYKFKP